jgi:hypothetical protein
MVGVIGVSMAACGDGAERSTGSVDASIEALEPAASPLATTGPKSDEASPIPRLARVSMPTGRAGVKPYRDSQDARPEHPTLVQARALTAHDKWLEAALAEAPKGLSLAKEGFVSEAWVNPSPTDWSHLGAVVPHRADDPVRISPVRHERWAMSLRPRGFSPVVGELDRGRVVYRDALPHADLIAIARERELEELFVLRDAAAPTELRWKLEIGTGLTLRTAPLPDGSIDFLDARGDAALRIRSSYALDAAGLRREAPTTIEGDELVVRLDPKGLRFPVLLDPVAEVPVWQQKATTGIPASNAQALVYSADMAQTLYVGGGVWNGPCSTTYDSSLYGWNGSAWSTIAPPAGLLPRGTAATSPYGAGVMVFGGANCTTNPLGDTWIESGGSWRQVCATGSCGVPGQMNPGLAQLATPGNFLSYAPSGAAEGCWADGTALGRDLPTYLGNSGASGTGYTPSTCTAACKSAGYSYAGVQNSTECWCGNSFGRYGRSSICTSACTADTSQNCGGVWAQSVYWTGVGGGMYLFGSANSNTYVFGPGASGWAQFPMSGPGDSYHIPPARNGAVMVADPNLGYAFLFGGIAPGGTAPLPDGWLLNPAAPGTYGYDPAHSHWSSVCGIGGALPCAAPARFGALATYDANRKKVVMYGGYNGGDLGDTWEYDVASNAWTSLCYPLCAPGYREGTALSYDPVRRRVVMAGGYNFTWKSDTWELYVRGGSCAADADCDTGHCFGGTCCESVCTQCQTCSAAGSEGTCTNIPAGSPDPVSACPSAGQCNGSGACKTPLGLACSANADCAAGHCVNGYCCSQASCASGFSCSNASGANAGGLCLPVNGTSCTSNAQCSSNACVDGVCCGSASCAAGSRCNYGTPPAGACLLDNGRACTSNAQCGSGNCVDGVCCNTACTQQCQACDVGGAVGTCVTVSGAAHPNASGTTPRAACAGSGTCGALCNGADATKCNYPGAGTTCGAASCAGGVQTNVGACNGSGACGQTATPCGAYTCSGASCKTSCAFDADCASGSYYCSGGACLPKQPNGNACTAANGCASGFCVGNLCCDAACSTTGFTCNLPTARGHCAKANGTACGGNAECGSGFCVDGVCCESSCGGQCQACDVPGLVGTCSPVVGAPHGGRSACTGTGAGTACGPACNGTSATTCAYPTASTKCGADTCTDGGSLSTFTHLGTCNGSGSCNTASGDCSTYKCSGSSCRTACTTKADCQSGNYCSAGLCVPIQGLGKACADATACPSGYCVDGVCCGSASCDAGSTCNASPATAGRCAKLAGQKCGADADCGSLHCVDGVCCNSACTGPCEACNVSGKEGSCVPIVGQPKPGHPACSTTPTDTVCGLTCDGTDATACHDAPPSTSCGSATCAGAIENDVTTCDGAGHCPSLQRSCGVYQCGPIRCLTACVTDGDCASGNFCKLGVCVGVQDLGHECAGDAQCKSSHCADGVCCAVASCGAGAACAGVGASAGQCLKGNGVACAASAECAAGHCVDGVCCDKGCDGQCEACDVKGSEGTCTPVTGTPHGGRSVCDALGATDCAKTACDGATRDKCGGFANGTTTTCGEDACTPDKSLQKHGACDGHGGCAMPDPTSCVEYACDPAAKTCKSRCAGDTDCGASFKCDTAAGKCVQGASCSDDHSASIDKAGVSTSCAPYLCGTDGSCLKSCATSDDCVSGTSCDTATHACIGIDAATQSSGGCDVGGAPSGGGAGLGVAALLGLSVGARRRVRRPR